MRFARLSQLLGLIVGTVFLVGCVIFSAPVESTGSVTSEPPTATPTPVLPANTPAPPTPPPDRPRDTAFKTPEKAITHYFEGMAQANVDKILQACAIDEPSEKFRFDLLTEMTKMLPLHYHSMSPASHPLYIAINKAQRSATILESVKMFAFGLLSSEPVGDGRTVIIDAEGADNFARDVDPQRLAGLKVERIEWANEKMMSLDAYQRQAARFAGAYGADESTERVALFSFEQKYYYVGFTLLRYGENWKIYAQASQMAGVSNLGVPTQTTIEEFEDVVKGK